MDGHLKLLIPVGTVIESAALIIFWRTEGFGKTDEGMALTEPLPLDAGLTSGHIERSFSVVVPQIPWTYHGRPITIRWYAGVYVTPSGGPEVRQEVEFVLHPDPNYANR